MTFLCVFVGICVFISTMLQGTVSACSLSVCPQVGISSGSGQAIHKDPSTKLDEVLYFL